MPRKKQEEPREPFTARLKPSITDVFKDKLKEKGDNQYDVIEKMMTDYINNN